MILKLLNPYISMPSRLRAVKNILAIGVITNILLTWRLWTSDRLFPQIPLIDGIRPLLHPYDKILFGWFVLLAVFMLVNRRPRPAILLFFLTGIFMCLSDQTRMQPWFYQYMLMIFVLMFYNWRVDEPKIYSTVFTTIKIVMGLVYIWSGLQKINPHFFNETWPYLIKPFERFGTPEMCNYLQKFGYLVPFIELFIGLGLWFRSSSQVAVITGILMHVLVILMMAPFSEHFNAVMVAWNVTSIFLLYIIFAGRTEVYYYHLSSTLAFKPLYVVVFLMGIMPALYFFNRWDANLSYTQFSGKNKSADIYLTFEARKKLPFYLQYFTYETERGYYRLPLNTWAMHELQVPGYPEKRVFLQIESYIRQITCCDDEVSIRFSGDKEMIAAK